MVLRETWSFAHITDHLVIVRRESSHAVDMLGQKSKGENSEVLTLH
jgi:hypothetical protein